MSRYLVTPALPYANGPIHLGHLVEHTQVNIFVRALRMAGEKVLYVCGADSHGTPIEMNARKAGQEPHEYAAHWQQKHEQTFERFFVEFDGGYGTTHTDENKAHAAKIFKAFEAKGHTATREVEQFYDEQEGRFLADRNIRGTCPKCKSEDQYGDTCEKCNSKYEPTDLIDPKSALSGTKPVLRSSTHVFVKLGDFADALKDWAHGEGRLNDYVKNFLKTWFEEGLNDWDISRDAPYHGFEIPGFPGKYFYVWLDAPIGYISLSERAAIAQGETFEDYWKDPETRIYNFVGKDIVYFHTLFWPAMLMAADYNVPTCVPVHGMLTVDGVKMSKSRGTFINADDWAEALGDVGVEGLRYYFACKLTDGSDDMDLNIEDFVARVNSDLVNKVVNLISRTVPLLHRYFDGKVSTLDETATEMTERAFKIGAGIEAHYRDRQFARVVKDVVEMADEANKYLQDSAPWEVAKSDPEKAQQILTTALTIGKACVAFLKPILPRAGAEFERILDVEFRFDSACSLFEPGHVVKKYEHVIKRLDLKKITALVEATAAKNAEGQSNAKAFAPTKDIVEFPNFSSLELRAAKVLEAKDVEGAKRLISLTLDVGALGQCHVFTGLKPHVQAADLQDRTLMLVANLKPRKMKFGLSEGMVLSVGEPPKPIFLDDAAPGDEVA